MGLVGSALGLWTLLRWRRQQRWVSENTSAWARLAAIVMACLWLNLLVQTLLTPQRLWDERAIFGIKSAVLFEEGTIRSDDLQHPRFVQYHPRYPLLLPLAEEYIYGWMGHVNDRWSKLIAPLSALGLWLVFAGVLQRHIGADRTWLATLLLASVPALTVWEYSFLSVQADAIVGSFHGLSVLYLWDGWRTWERGESVRPFRGRSVAWVIAGLAAGFCLFTKDEGLALAMVDVVAMGLVTLLALVWQRRGKGDFRTVARSNHAFRLIAWLVPIGVVAMPWFYWRGQLPTTTEMTYFDRLSGDNLATGLASLTWGIPHLLTRMFLEATTWGLMWWGMLLTALAVPRRLLRPSQVLLLLDVLGALSGILIAGMLAPTAVEEHLGGSSHRFLLQIIPVAVLFLAGQLWGDDESQPSTE